MKTKREDIRNIAIIAHVDHGKTTLVDELLKQSGVFRENQEVAERVMDSNDIERERGITILSKNTAVHYKGTKINIIDTPGHADFGGEVERVLKMVNGVVLVVDAFEGAMPQTKFVLKKALELDLPVIVCINKIDRPEARPTEVIDEVLELFLELDASEEQLDCPFVYASAKSGYAMVELDDEHKDMQPLFETIVNYIPAPEGDPDADIQLLISTIDYNEYVGRIGIGKIDNGTLKVNQEVMMVNAHDPEKQKRVKINKLYEFDGLAKVEVNEATIGAIVAVSGIADIHIGDTICSVFALHTEDGNAKASDLCNKLVGTDNGYGAYQAWGEINLNFKDIDESNVTNYMRDLDLKTAISSVNYTEGNTKYTREYFVSHPDDVMVIRVEAEGNEKLNFDVSFPSKQGAKTIVEDDTITLKGEVSDNQLKYNSQLKVISDSGNIIEGNNKLTVEEATSATIYISAATDYKNDYPVYRTGETEEELNARVEEVISEVVKKSYDEVRADHVSDYKSIFDRVELDLGQALPNIPTDELLSGYGNNTVSEEARRALEVMFFQYGRYLTIASSREDSQLPSNLQGVWNNKNNPSWSSDYHMNVNLQMNYWPTYSTNMVECATPLINYIDSLREPGRETARIYAGVESAKDQNGEYIEANGFMAHTQNTPFGWTCPGWSFDWGWSPAAVPWILQNVWEMYEYTGDIEYMRDVIYPIMKEEVNLYENMLVWDEVQERMVSSPTYSPEHGPRTVGNTYEQTLIWQLYEDTIKAAEDLGVDADKVAKWKDTQSKLDPIQIGDDGQIKEWYEETTLNSIPSEGYNHRHMSHLLGLFPGDSISVETPELLEAALVSLNNRTDQSTGWGMGQRINSWARAGQGNKAYELLTKQLKKVGTGQAGGGGTYSNLWDAHPPFQIDGNFGATAGISEMLMQSNMGYINFLPALPDVWADGSYDGLLARGNFEVGAKWSNGKAYELTIKSNNGGEAVVKYEGLNLATVINSKGENVEFTTLEEDKISFNTEVGETYAITEIPVSEKLLDAPTGLVAERISFQSPWFL